MNRMPAPSHRPLHRSLRGIGLALALGVLGSAASADEAAIRKTLAERMPQLPKIDEVTRTPIPGLYEVRMGQEVVYADETGQHLIEGSIIETATRRDLTAARIDKLTAVAFASLPLQDAVVIKQGNGSRKLAVFVDPNCGYCKKLEKDLQAIKDVTIYNFLYPVLGPDSDAKARNIWCHKGQAALVWRRWMVEGIEPPRSMGTCDASAIARNSAMGKRMRINGTPALIFEDGTRAPGALPGAQVEVRLQAASAKKG